MHSDRTNPVSGHVYRHEGKRGPVWRAKYRLPDGRQVHKAIGPVWTDRGRPPGGHYTKRLAEDWLRDTLEQARRGTLPGLVQTGATFARAADDYLEHLERDRQLKPSTLRDYRSILRAHLLPAFGASQLEDITQSHVERFMAQLVMSNRTKVKVLTLAHGVLERARRTHGLPSNPCADVEKPRTRRAAGIDVFTPEEVHALVRAADSEQDAALYLTAAFTGLRQGELIALRWRDVDFAGQVIRVRASYSSGQQTTPKSGKVRAVPLAPEVAQALARLDANPDAAALVFPGITGFLDDSALRRRYKRALREAGLRDLRFHDLRHTFGTRVAASGVPMTTLREWMGHADLTTTMGYAHYAGSPRDAELVAAAFAPQALPVPA